MKYIEKVAVSKIPKINGSVVDTFNVEDKTTNAPSIRAVEEKFEVTDYELSDLPAHSGGANAYMLKRTGNIVVLAVDNIWINSVAANTWTNIGKIPDELKPAKNNQAMVVVSDSLNGNPISYGKINVGSDGIVKCKVTGSNNNLSAFSFNIVWIV